MRHFAAHCSWIWNTLACMIGCALLLLTPVPPGASVAQPQAPEALIEATRKIGMQTKTCSAAATLEPVSASVFATKAAQVS